MKIINPKIEVEKYDGKKIMKNIERACRTCYRSENLITEDSYKRLLTNCLNRGHESVLEHEKITVRMICDVGSYKELSRHRFGSFSIESTRYCVAEGMRIDFSNPHLKYTIDTLYKNKTNSKNGAWKRMKIKNINEDTGEIIFNKIKDIACNGEKECLEIKTKLGYSIILTPEHLIYTPQGYIKAENLIVGDKIYVNGQKIDEDFKYKNYDWLYHQNITLNKTFVQISKEFGYNVSTLKDWARRLGLPKKGTGYFNKGKIPWNKGLTEQDDERVKRQAEVLRTYHWESDKIYDKSEDGSIIMKQNTVNYQKHNKGVCEVCHREKNIQVHHINKNREDNVPANLISLCSNCHQQLHKKGFKMIYADEIVSIENVGKRKVYDIEMDNNFHNFVANGIVVHNCNYNKDKFGNEIKFIRPVWYTSSWKIAQEYNEPITEEEQKSYEWYECMEEIEQHYLKMSELGCTPDEMRMILPHSTAAEVTMTANIREWRHILDLRTKKMAHPSVRQILIPLLLKFKEDMPELFGNIEYDTEFPKEWYAEISDMED